MTRRLRKNRATDVMSPVSPGVTQSTDEWHQPLSTALLRGHRRRPTARDGELRRSEARARPPAPAPGGEAAVELDDRRTIAGPVSPSAGHSLKAGQRCTGPTRIGTIWLPGRRVQYPSVAGTPSAPGLSRHQHGGRGLVDVPLRAQQLRVRRRETASGSPSRSPRRSPRRSHAIRSPRRGQSGTRARRHASAARPASGPQRARSLR